jgi:hypothetical protein
MKRGKAVYHRREGVNIALEMGYRRGYATGHLLFEDFKA